jgi:Family of unknown function (DUF6345)
MQMERRKRFSSVKVCVAVLFVAAMCLSATDSRAAAHFGTLCQADYQNNWKNTLPYSWDRCGWFNDELDDTDIFDFYWNLHGARTLYSSCDGCAGMGADTVSLLYTNTHGGALNDTDARIAMWDQNVRARTNTDSWRLGDESIRLSILALYACETLTSADSSSQLADRWRNTFRGGLRMALGSHDKLYDSVTTNEVGEDFADNLQDGDTIKWAWFDGNGDWYEDQDVKVLASGTDSSNCSSRKNDMKWQNFGSFPRLRDGSVGWFCSSRIDNN